MDIQIRLKPKRGGFMRPFGCGWFIREYLSGNSPHGAPIVDPTLGAPQAEIFFHYKTALINELALDRAVRHAEQVAKAKKQPISPDLIERFQKIELNAIPYKTTSCRYHSFVVYFSQLTRLGWVEASGLKEPSAFQSNYPKGPERKYYRLTKVGFMAGDSAWANPQRVERG